MRDEYDMCELTNDEIYQKIKDIYGKSKGKKRKKLLKKLKRKLRDMGRGFDPGTVASSPV